MQRVVGHRASSGDRSPIQFSLLQAAVPHPPGVSDGTRTRDILDHNQVLYQLSYTHHASGPNSVSRTMLRSVKCTGRRLRRGNQFSTRRAPVKAPR
jgi:hypothetical protein